MSSFLAEKKQSGSGSHTDIQAVEAGQLIVSSSYEPAIGFDEDEARVLGLIQGADVLIAPDDTGKMLHVGHEVALYSMIVGRDSPTRGKLVGFTLAEAVIETSGVAGAVRVHFPRLGFTIHPSKESAS
jgi:hypothetical protein